ncbi:MAG: PulJ/GspJ family protein [Pirellulales bacterium]|jgi:type II secretory pathway component PulJ
MNRRRGVSLIEMLVAIEVGTVVLGLAVGLLYLLFQVQTNSRERLAAGHSVDRLAEQFRQDVRAATGLMPAGEGTDPQSRLAFALPLDRSVEYRLTGNVALRTEQAGQKVLRRETFALLPGDTIHWETRPERKELVSLIIASAGQAEKNRPTRSLKIDAALGADGRYASPKE